MNEIAIRPILAMTEAKSVADACKAIVLQTSVQIGQKQYVQVEGWMAIAVAHGCTLSAGQVHGNKTDGFSSVGEVKRISDGTILTTAEGFVGNDEKMWRQRPEFACRAMAQTRAMSRAARSAFAHVVVLMDAGLGTTPAEEMMGIDPEPPSNVIEIQAQKLSIEDERVKMLDGLIKAGAWFEKHGVSMAELEQFIGFSRSDWGQGELAKLTSISVEAKRLAKNNPDQMGYAIHEVMYPGELEG